jgi:hypothetical protein
MHLERPVDNDLSHLILVHSPSVVLRLCAFAPLRLCVEFWLLRRRCAVRTDNGSVSWRRIRISGQRSRVSAVV